MRIRDELENNNRVRERKQWVYFIRRLCFMCFMCLCVDGDKCGYMVPGLSIVRSASLDRGDGSDIRRFERYG